MKNWIFLFLCLFCSEKFLTAQSPDSLFHSPVQKSPRRDPISNVALQTDSKKATPSSQPQAKNLAKQEQTKTGTTREEEENTKQSSPHHLNATVAFLSDYRSRGISQTFRRPAVQGEFKYTHASGWYFKSWGSNVDGTSHFINNASLEWDLYFGFQHPFYYSQAKCDIGLLYYYYPGGRPHVPTNVSYNTLESYLSLTYKKLEVKLSVTLTDFFANNSSNPPMNWDKNRPIRPNGHSYGSPYLEINYEYPFFFKWKAAFHIGYQAVVNYSQLNYVDWLVNLTRTFDWFEVTLSYIQTNARKAFYKVPDNSYHPRRIFLGGPGIVLGVNRTF